MVHTPFEVLRGFKDASCIAASIPRNEQLLRYKKSRYAICFSLLHDNKKIKKLQKVFRILVEYQLLLVVDRHIHRLVWQLGQRVEMSSGGR